MNGVQKFKEHHERTTMTKRYRLILITISFIVLIAVGYSVKGNFLFIYKDFWFTSGLLLLVLLSLIDQPHFSKDSNIFVNAVTAGISLLLVEETNRDFLFFIFLGVTLYLLISSYALLWAREKPLLNENKLVRFLSRLNREIGKPEAIFSAFFLWGAFKQFGAGTNEFNALLLYWVVFTILNVSALSKAIEDLFITEDSTNEKNAVGEIFSIQSKNTFLIKLYNPSNTKSLLYLFDFVEFKYPTDGPVNKGVVIEIYELNNEKWAKVLSTIEVEAIFSNKAVLSSHSDNVIYKLSNIPGNDFLKKFVGLVADNSKISHVRFNFNSNIEIFEGSLLEIVIYGKKVLYQIIEGLAKVETLEQKNQTGLIIGEAIQLGTWNEEKLQFEQYGWVPRINSPVNLATNIEAPLVNPHEYVIGAIPNTNYPVILNKKTAMSHHMAIVGVTGTGKSVFSRNLIREYLKDEDVKVICIDFTGEYIGKFADLNPTETIEAQVAQGLFKGIDFIEKEQSGNYGKDTDKSTEKKKEVSEAIHTQIKAFLEGDSKLSIFDLPHVENTSGVLTYTKTFFRVLFHIAKTQGNFGKRVCLVLEEAHTIVPEWNFSGVSDKVSQPLLNSIAQIALQGRKYNIGLMVIAQRTANVSKTILTQCNTIISFQEFDKTSADFLANYFGQDIASSLPKLKFRQAIAAGKAFRSSVPIIFEVPEILE